MATQPRKSARRASRKNSNQTPWGWIAAAVILAVLLFASWANSITRVDVGTVQGDLAAMQAQLTAQAQVTVTPVVTETQAATFVPTTIATQTMIPTQAPAQPTTASAYCGQARDLGPWAPSNGVGETFEVTATKNDSTGIVLGLWFPAGNTPWGQKEITTFVEPGLSIEVQAGAGRGFDYPVGCSATEVDSQMAAHIVQRKLDTTYNGYVDVDELIRLGLVVVRFDRRGQ